MPHPTELRHNLNELRRPRTDLRSTLKCEPRHPKLSYAAHVKELSHEIKLKKFTELGLSKGRGWLLNFLRGSDDFLVQNVYLFIAVKASLLPIFVILSDHKWSIIIRVSDPDPYWIRIQSDHWIRIRNLNTDPDPGGQK
jgi:hypothetical protein